MKGLTLHSNKCLWSWLAGANGHGCTNAGRLSPAWPSCGLPAVPWGALKHSQGWVLSHRIEVILLSELFSGPLSYRLRHHLSNCCWLFLQWLFPGCVGCLQSCQVLIYGSPQAAFSVLAFLSWLQDVVLWEASFHRPYYNLFPLGEYIYLGRNTKLRTAIQTAGILLPVFLFYQIELVAGETDYFFPSQTFFYPHCHFNDSLICVTALTQYRNHCIVQQVPAVAGLQGICCWSITLSCISGVNWF